MSAIAIHLIAVTHAVPGSLARRLIIAALGGGSIGLAVGLGGASSESSN